MNIDAYDAVRRSEQGAVVYLRKIGLVRVTGRDCGSFLNGQVTTNTLTQQPGKTVKSCLLNNTGHIIADLIIHRLTDQFWIETPIEQRDKVIATLERFVVREKVEVAVLNSDHASISIQGKGAGSSVVRVLAGRTSFVPAEELEHTEFIAGDSHEVIVRYPEFAPSDGYTIIAPTDHAHGLITSLRDEAVIELDDDTSNVLRVESESPAWGAELTEALIPLEAGLDGSIDFHKGCYMGQEVIARIKSRGHTNWTLSKLSVSPNLEAGIQLFSASAKDSGKADCRVTSVANSPVDGWIGLGYTRREVPDIESSFTADDPKIWAKIV